MPPKPEPNKEPPVDAPGWTPDVREPDPTFCRTSCQSPTPTRTVILQSEL